MVHNYLSIKREVSISNLEIKIATYLYLSGYKRIVVLNNYLAIILVYSYRYFGE